MATKIQLQEKTKRRLRRSYAIRDTVRGTAERPRLVVFRSNTNIYAQLVDDSKGFTLATAGSKADQKQKKSDKSVAVGKQIAQIAKEKGISKVVFDRNGYLYHGRVKALADAAREGGLQF
ncbi:MAG TPA: 50S ribosomal protein L18 [Candidatus Kapabacteria bacterium]|nr:50S ribosomal protein L18 [Candidatus Kapabacteria bacterium]HYM36399.1 50S ribosomal protein L18 [Steroidobacteraceae bacterium]